MSLNFLFALIVFNFMSTIIDIIQFILINISNIMMGWYSVFNIWVLGGDYLQSVFYELWFVSYFTFCSI